MITQAGFLQFLLDAIHEDEVVEEASLAAPPKALYVEMKDGAEFLVVAYAITTSPVDD